MAKNFRLDIENSWLFLDREAHLKSVEHLEPGRFLVSDNRRFAVPLGRSDPSDFGVLSSWFLGLRPLHEFVAG